MTLEVIDCEQGSPEWYEARRGIPTASMFQTIMAGGEGRTTYLRKKAGERITGELSESFSNEHMKRGRTMEAEARAWYKMMFQARDVRQVGFLRREICGGSPDALVDDDRVLEIKTALPHILIPMLEAQEKNPDYFPAKHRAQCQGNLFVAGRTICDIIVYWPKMPVLHCTQQLDSSYVADLHNAVQYFDLDLRRLVTKLKGM